MSEKSAFYCVQLLGILWFGGCTILADVDYTYVLVDAGSGGAGSTGSVGSGGSGGSPVTMCELGASQPCYSGPLGTQDVGLCRAGTQVCLPDQSGYGDCVDFVAPKTEDCASADDESCDANPGCTGAHVWSHAFGDAGDQFGQGVAVDRSGNVILVGYFGDGVDFGGGPLLSAGGPDIFVAKFDPTGKHLWSQRFGDSGEQYGYGVAIDGANHIVLVGHFDGAVDFGGGPLESAGGLDIFVAKLDPEGKHVFSERFGDAEFQYGYDVAVDGAGHIYFTGNLRGTVDFGDGPLPNAADADVFLAKRDAAGAPVWSKSFGGGGIQYGSGVAVGPSGTVVFSGSFSGPLDLGGGALSSAGGVDVFVATLDGQGNHIWSKSFGGAMDDEPRGLAVDSAGNVLLAGDYTSAITFGGPMLVHGGGTDVFVAKLSSKGSHVFSKGFGDGDFQHGRSVAVDGLGNVLLTGDFQGEMSFGGTPVVSVGGADIFVAKLDAGGDEVWRKRAGDANDQQGQDIALDVTGGALVTGYFIGLIDFDGSSIASAGLASDILAVKLAP